MNTESGNERPSNTEHILHPERLRHAGSAAIHLQLNSAEAGEAVVEQTPATFLQAMRAAVKMDPIRSRAYGRKFSHNPIRNQLLRIHEALLPHQDLKAVTNGDVERLCHNVARLQDTTQRFTFSFLEQLYRAYAKDAEVFKTEKLPTPGLLALYHSPQIIQEINQKYSSHPVVDKAAIIIAFAHNRGDPEAELETLISKVQAFKDVTEPQLREEYGFKGDWGHWFVRELIQTKQSEQTARQIFSLVAQIHERYPTAPLDQVESLAMRSVSYRGKRGVDAQASVNELLADIPYFSYGESNLVFAEEQLKQLRLAQHEGNVMTGARSLEQKGLRLASIAKANWHPSFEAIDLEREGRYIWHVSTIYNQRVADKGAEPPISMDYQNLCHMLVIFARDTIALHKRGVIEPARIARFYGADAFDHYKEKYNISTSALRKVFGQSACSGNGIENSLIRLATLKEQYGTYISASTLHEWACRPDALTTLPGIASITEKTQVLYPWASKADIVRVCRRADFEDYLVTWDAKIKEIKLLYPDHKDLPPYRQKRLAKFEGDAATITADYFSRFNDIMDAYGESQFVSRYYALKWAESKEGYLQHAAAHNVRVEEYNELLNSKGLLHVDPAILGHLAFFNNDPEKGTNKFLENRKALDEFRQDYRHREHIEQWMVDRIATKNTGAKYLRIQLRTMARLKRNGAFDKSIYAMPHRGRPLHERLANPPNDADDNQAQLEHVFSRLALFDRKAVMVVFGFAQDISKSELEEELDVPDLDKYVLEEVVPHLTKLSKAL